MDFLSNTLAETLGGLIAAAIIAAITIAINEMRTTQIHNSIRNSLTRHGITFSKQGFGISILNKTPIYLIIREVKLTYKDGWFGLNCVGVKRNIASGDEAEKSDINEFLNFSAVIDSVPEWLRFQLLPAYTTASWVTPLEGVLVVPKFTGCEIQVEYPTLFGGRAFMTIEASSGNILDLNEMVVSYMNWRKGVPTEPNTGKQSMSHNLTNREA